jgi:peptidoglycan hydrolase-like protein with peptidoglycan-binding domain
VAFYQCGTRGPEVAIIQAKLKEKGTYNGSVDGDFGGGTESAVKAFQRSVGLAADGVVGIMTWDKLFGGKSRVKEPAIRSSPLLFAALLSPDRLNAKVPHRKASPSCQGISTGRDSASVCANGTSGRRASAAVD